MRKFITMSGLTVSENFGSQIGNLCALYRIGRMTGHRTLFLEEWKQGIGMKVDQAFETFPFEMVSIDSLGEQTINIYQINQKIVIDPNVFELDRDTNYDLKGLFTSYKYWYGVRDEILNIFRFRDDINEKAQKSISTLRDQGKPIVSIHVRRGDYLTSMVHEELSMDYYESAFLHFSPQKYNFLVFSDDIPWCREAFAGRGDFFYSEENSPYIDMCKMSLCDHNIIANSSFSFWGAMLNRNPGKTVIGPSRFIAIEEMLPYLNGAWLPDDWISIPSRATKRNKMGLAMEDAD